MHYQNYLTKGARDHFEDSIKVCSVRARVGEGRVRVGLMSVRVGFKFSSEVIIKVRVELGMRLVLDAG